MDHNQEVFETMNGMSQVLDKIEAEVARIRVVLANNRAKLNNNQPIGKLDTLFGVTDLAAMVNTASRWEGRLFERIDIGYEAEVRG